MAQGVVTIRPRTAGGAVTTLDLADALAANRRLDVSPATSHGGKRFLGFSWVKSGAVAVDVTIYRVDGHNTDKLYRREEILGDTSLDGHWEPPSEEMSGYDADAPNEAQGVGWRIQFSQAGGACTADVTADYKRLD